MQHAIPSPDEVRQRLAPLTRRQLVELVGASGVPLTTLQKIQSGETKEPGLGTVGKIWPLIDRIGVGSSEGVGAS